MTDVHFIDNNLSSFTADELAKIISQRNAALTTLYDIAEIAINKLHDHSLSYNNAKDIKDIAEALTALKILFANEG